MVTCFVFPNQFTMQYEPLKIEDLLRIQLVVYRTQIFRFGAETEQPNIIEKYSAEYRTEPNIFMDFEVFFEVHHEVPIKETCK